MERTSQMMIISKRFSMTGQSFATLLRCQQDAVKEIGKAQHIQKSIMMPSISSKIWQLETRSWSTADE